MDERIAKFVELFQVWDIAVPFLDLIVTSEEISLIVAMEGRALRPMEIREALGISEEEALSLIDRCYRRGILNKTTEDDGDVLYAPGDFYGRLAFMVRSDEWHRLAPEIRSILDARYLDEFVARKRPLVEKLRAGEPLQAPLHNEAVLLLPEIEEVIRAAEDIIVLPCDCRLLGQQCDRPLEVCLWMDDLARGMLDRGYGRRITTEEAIEIVRMADKRGLMHTTDPDWREHGVGAICNCCACDCYPFRAAEKLDSKGLWPKSLYVAEYTREKCSLCGACVRRCHFGAFAHDGQMVEIGGKMRRNVVFDPQLCWGCGLCVSTCPEEAIGMRPLELAEGPPLCECREEIE